MATPAPKLVHSESWLERVGEGFERSLFRRDLSPKTVRTYNNGIKNFFRFLREQGVDDLHYLTRDHIERWQDSLRDQVPVLKAGSRSLYSTAVRQLLRFAAEHDIVDWKLEKSVVGVRTRHREAQAVRQPIGEEDLARLMAYLGPRRARMTVVELRDRALFFVLLLTGARVNEVLQMPRERYEQCRVRQKGGSYIELELTPIVIEFVRDYLRARSDDLPWLWVALGNNTNAVRKLADSGVREAWRRLCFRLNIERFTTHQLRHTSATVLLEGDVDHLAVANHLHHADTRTVHRYAKVRGRVRQNTLDVIDQFIQDGARIHPQLLARRSPAGGRPRYGRGR